MRAGGTRAGFSTALMAVLAIAVSAHGQGSSCCSTDAETALILSEFNYREVSISNAVQYLCEQTEKEHGVKLKMDLDANPPEVHVSMPSGLGDDGQWVAQELKKQVEEQVANTYVPPKLWGERKITLSLRNVPVCEALKYILGLSLSGAEIPCQRQGRDLILGRPQLRKIGRIYRIRPEAWKDLERSSRSYLQRTEAARGGTHVFPVYDPREVYLFPAHVCLPERHLVIAAGLEPDLDGFKKTLVDHGWLETANGH
jgi:hypothetical protein